MLGSLFQFKIRSIHTAWRELKQGQLSFQYFSEDGSKGFPVQQEQTEYSHQRISSNTFPNRVILRFRIN